MEYTAYGSQQPTVRVSYRGDRACVRRTGDYTPPDPRDEQSSGSWLEVYGEFDAIETPSEIDIRVDLSAWWTRCAAWEADAGVPVPAIEELTTKVNELQAVIDTMLTGGAT